MDNSLSFKQAKAKNDEEIKSLNSLVGGKADKLSIEDIAKKHGVSVEDIERQLEKGTKVEKEHTDNDEKAKEIAMDHLTEIADYYDRLDEMEQQAEKK